MKDRFFKAAMGIGLAALMICSAATGCSGSDKDAVPVQSVSSITGMGAIGMVDRFSGLVVSGKTEEIRLDDGMTVDEVMVEVGQEVNEGDVLFTYDTEAMQLSLEQSELEIQSLQNSITTSKSQIAQLEKDKKTASESEKLSYTLEIQSLETQIKETEYNISLKQKELERQKAALTDSDVKSPVAGCITAINESGTDDYGNPLAYMVITETDNLRIKGTINELNRNSITEGSQVTIRSRTDDTMVWNGIVETIDWDSQITNNNNYYYGSSDEMSTSSKYPFYVTLDITDGLFLGQHVYIEPSVSSGSSNADALWLPSYYINDFDSEPWVWADNGHNKLEKRSVVLGEYNPETDEYAIESGLTADDNIALPDETYEEGMRVTLVDDLTDLGDSGYADDGYVDDGFVDDGFVDDGIYDDGAVSGAEG